MLRCHRSSSECSKEKSREWLAYQYLYKLSSHNRDAWNCAAKIEIRSRNDNEMEVETERGTMKSKGTLYWELSSSLSSGISPFLVVEKYLESFLLIFPYLLRHQYYSSLLPLPISDFWFLISDSEPRKQHRYAWLDRGGRKHRTAS